MSFFPGTGTAPIDLGPRSPHGKIGCIFECADPYDLTKDTIRVEMNVDVDGKMHPYSNHPQAEHRGALIVTERVAGIAHLECYRTWYEQTYRTPFTMSA